MLRVVHMNRCRGSCRPGGGGRHGSNAVEHLEFVEGTNVLVASRVAKGPVDGGGGVL